MDFKSDHRTSSSSTSRALNDSISSLSTFLSRPDVAGREVRVLEDDRNHPPPSPSPPPSSSSSTATAERGHHHQQRVIPYHFHGTTTTTKTTTSTTTVETEPSVVLRRRVDPSTPSSLSGSRSTTNPNTSTITSNTKSSTTTKTTIKKKQMKQLYFWNTVFGRAKTLSANSVIQILKEEEQKELTKRNCDRGGLARPSSVTSKLTSTGQQQHHHQQQQQQHEDEEKNEPLEIIVKIVYCTGKVHQVVSKVLEYQYNKQQCWKEQKSLQCNTSTFHQYQPSHDNIGGTIGTETRMKHKNKETDGNKQFYTVGGGGVTCLVLHGPICRRTVMALNDMAGKCRCCAVTNHRPIKDDMSQTPFETGGWGEMPPPKSRKVVHPPPPPPAATLLRSLCLHEATLLEDDVEQQGEVVEDGRAHV